MACQSAWGGVTRGGVLSAAPVADPPAVGANGQPAFGYYVRDRRAQICHANGLMVVTLAGDRICVMSRFLDNSVLPQFGLPRTLPDLGGPGPAP